MIGGSRSGSFNNRSTNISPNSRRVSSLLFLSCLFLCTLVFPNSTGLVSPNLQAVNFPNDFFPEAVTVPNLRFLCLFVNYMPFMNINIPLVIHVSIANLYGKSISGLGFFKF